MEGCCERLGSLNSKNYSIFGRGGGICNNWGCCQFSVSLKINMKNVPYTKVNSILIIVAYICMPTHILKIKIAAKCICMLLQRVCIISIITQFAGIQDRHVMWAALHGHFSQKIVCQISCQRIFHLLLKNLAVQNKYFCIHIVFFLRLLII